MRIRAAVLLLAGALPFPALPFPALAAAPPHWITSWAASMVAATPSPDGQYEGQTIHTIEHLSAGGRAIRLRISNEYGKHTLSIGAIHAALSRQTAQSGAVSGIYASTDQVVTFAGLPTLDVPAGAVAVSDPIPMTVPAQANLAVSLYLTATDTITEHVWAWQTVYVVDGDQTGAVNFSQPTKIQTRPYLAGVDVLGVPQAATAVALGDSITDGWLSPADTNTRWPDLLAARLVAAYGNRVGVAQQGIAGNTILGDVGPTISARFNQDVVSQAGRRWVLLLAGINDIQKTASHPGQAPTADQLIAADRALIARAHEAGMKIYGMTVLPYGGSGNFDAAGERRRQALNAFIRTSGEFDAVVDTDAALRDPNHPTQYLPAYDGGDHLHPNEAGMQAIADTFDLGLFGPGE